MFYSYTFRDKRFRCRWSLDAIQLDYFIYIQCLDNMRNDSRAVSFVI